jgi:hypothetical protein
MPLGISLSSVHTLPKLKKLIRNKNNFNFPKSLMLLNIITVGYPIYHYAKCRYSECRSTECRGA